MSRLSDDIAKAAGAASDETAWEWIEDDTICLQRPCPDCLDGLVDAPVRFCDVCGGAGFLVRFAPAPGSKVTP